MTGDLALRAEENLLAFAEAWALASGGERWHRDGMLVVASGAPMRAFNNVVITDVTPRLRGNLCEAIGAFARRGVPFRVRLRDALAPGAADALSASGLALQGRIPCLVMSPIVDSGAPPAVEIRPVEDAATLRHHVEVVAGAFGWQPDRLAEVFTERLLEDGRWRGYVGYADGRPVASSQLMLSDGSAGIYYVGTLEAYRRRGYGEALTWHAVREAARAGCDSVSLQASPMGLPIYERMGFRTIGAYDGFVQEA